MSTSVVNSDFERTQFQGDRDDSALLPTEASPSVKLSWGNATKDVNTPSPSGDNQPQPGGTPNIDHGNTTDLEKGKEITDPVDAAFNNMSEDAKKIAKEHGIDLTAQRDEYIKKMASIGLSENDIKEMTRPFETAMAIEQNWDKWKLDGFDFSDPTRNKQWNKLPDDAKAIINYIGESGNFRQAIDCQNGKGKKADGKISRDDFRQFLVSSSSDNKAAFTSLKKYVDNNPNADPAALAMAKSAAILMANQTLVSGSGGDMAKGASNQRGFDHNLRLDNMKSVASDSTMSPALRDAAAFWQQPGARAFADTFKTKSQESPDGVLEQSELSGWLEKTKMKTTDDALAALNVAAERNAVADVDLSKVKSDFAGNLGAYDGATKAAIMSKLCDISLKFQSGVQAGLYDSKYVKILGYSGAPPDAVLKRMGMNINALAADKDVQEYLAKSRGTQLQSLVNSNSSLKSALENYSQTKMVDGTALKDAMSLKGADGKPASVPDRLRVYSSNLSTVTSALGQTNLPDLAQVAEKAGVTKEIKDYYDSEIKTGKSLRESPYIILKPEMAIQQFASDEQLTRAMLGKSVSDDDVETMKSNFADSFAGAQFERKDTGALLDVFGDGKGGVDEDKITKAFEDAVAQNPELGKTADGKPLDGKAVAKEAKNVIDSVRKGEKFSDALAKSGWSIGEQFKEAGPLYQKGAMHAVSAMILGGLTLSNDKGAVSTIGNACAVAGGLIEGGVKYTKYMIDNYATKAKDGAVTLATINKSSRAEVADTLNNIVKKSGINLSQTESLAKVVGSVGGIIGSYYTLSDGVDALKNGDKLTGAMYLATGSLGGVAAFSGLAEGALGFLATKFEGEMAAQFKLWSTRFGALSGGAGAAASDGAAVLPLLAIAASDVNDCNKTDDFLTSIDGDLRKYGYSL